MTASSMVATGGGDACPSCGGQMAADQRYCLECGARRGDPRLPFMDAVVFMDAMRQPAPATSAPAPPRERQPRMSANASLIAGVATLVLAIGVGVLIGRSGDSSSSNVAATTPQVIKVEGGGGGSETAEAATDTGSKGGKGGSAGSSKSKKAAESKSETGSSGTSKAAEEVLKPSGDVKLAPPKAKVGEDCEKGTAGCSDSGEFNGSFFE